MANTKQIKKDLETIKRALTPALNHRAKAIMETLREYKQATKEEEEATKNMTPKQRAHYQQESLDRVIQIAVETGLLNPEPSLEEAIK